VFSAYEAAEAAGLERYMLHTGFLVFLVLAVLILKLVPGGLMSMVGRYSAACAIGILVLMHLGFGYLLLATVSPSDNRHFKEVVTLLRGKSPELATIQVLCQNCDTHMPHLVAYYASPEVIVKGQFSIGRPVSNSQALNHKRNETRIHDQIEYQAFLHRSKIQGVLVLESDPELEHIMGVPFESGTISMFTVNEHGWEQVWQIQSPDLVNTSEPSLRKGLRAILGQWLRG
jgi:hypothetical protein